LGLESNLPYSIVDPLDAGKDIQYRNYFILSAIDKPMNVQRFMGVFEEPGIIGTTSGILLFINNNSLNNWRSYVIIISGLLSYSLAFYLLLLVWMIFNKKFIQLMLLFLVIVPLTGFLASLDSGLLEIFLQRFDFNQTTGLAGNVRTSYAFDKYYSEFCETFAYFWGVGGNMSSKIDPSGASYKHIILDSGLLFFLLYIACLFLYAKSKNVSTRGLIIYSVIVLSILYQRPFILLSYYIFLLTSPIIVLKNIDNEYNLRMQ
jgi:hypothetical protein